VALSDAQTETVVGLFWRVASERGEAVALREKVRGVWRSISWRTYADNARAVGLGLRALGLKRGERVAICSENRPEWLYCDMGILGAGGVSAGIYTTDSPQQIAYLVESSGARFYFAENDEQLDKCLMARERLSGLLNIIVFDTAGLGRVDDPLVIGFDALIERGRAHGAANPGLWDDSLGRIQPNDIATLIFTSGTTGPPKGAMITHRNVLFQIATQEAILPSRVDDTFVSFLPLSHIAERTFTTYRPLGSGAVVHFAESPETVPENLREVAPSACFAVPRIWEKLYSGIVLAMADATGFQRWAYGLALAIGQAATARQLDGRPVPPGHAVLFWLAKQLVLGNVRRMLGLDRARYLITAAAPISPDLIRWYRALGLNMLEVYGQTENTGLATIYATDRIKIGSVGAAAPGTEVRIAEDGEVLLRGPHVFAGYDGAPEKTAETLAGGWLHTGDIGVLDGDGDLTITDRKSDIIITAGGKNITPSEIENQLKFSPYISDAVVIGDGRKYLTCLIMIDHDNVAKFAQDHAVPFTNFASLSQAAAVRELVGREIERVNTAVARVETIKAFAMIDVKLTAEDDELTPTMKLKRKFVNQKYRAVIDSMYRDK
jgi:long-chain acyl-CoA synthetase